MSTANTKSAAITAADATQPPQTVQSWMAGTSLKAAIGSVAVAVADDNNSVYRCIRIPSRARIQKVEVISDSITGGTSYHVGLYKRAFDGGAVVDADFFVAGLDLSAGNTVPVEVTYGNVVTPTNCCNRIWEQLSLSADPMIEYDICLTGATVGSGAGKIALRAEWVE